MHSARARKENQKEKAKQNHTMQVGCGADELIDLLLRCVLDPGDAILDCPPTFGMYAFDADVCGARGHRAPQGGLLAGHGRGGGRRARARAQGSVCDVTQQP